MLWFAIAILGLAVVVFLGPRVRADLRPAFDAQSIGADVEAYLKQAEEKVGNDVASAPTRPTAERR